MGEADKTSGRERGECLPALPYMRGNVRDTSKTSLILQSHPIPRLFFEGEGAVIAARILLAYPRARSRSRRPGSRPPGSTRPEVRHNILQLSQTACDFRRKIIHGFRLTPFPDSASLFAVFNVCFTFQKKGLFT